MMLCKDAIGKTSKTHFLKSRALKNSFYTSSLYDVLQ